VTRDGQAVPGVVLGPSGLPVVDGRDVLAGFPFGDVMDGVTWPDPAGSPGDDPTAALRAALLPALLRPPCVVAFSGGRDSSLLLAVAADLAAREGLAPPVAHTLRYPDDPDAEESAWQELTIGHLARRGLRLDWTRTEIGEELDLLGPIMAPLLRAHGGPTYPPALAPTVLLARRAAPGALVTGNHGDEVLSGHRAAVLWAVSRRRGRGLARSDWVAAAFAAAPVRLRRRMAARHARGGAWLRPPLREWVAAQHAALLADRPLRYDRSVRAVSASRAAHLGRIARERVAADAGCALVEPFSAPLFVESMARSGGATRGPTRGGAVRLLAGPLLPEEVIGRRHKAFFNRSRFGQASHAFAQGWDGAGLDPNYVDAAALRAAWLADIPDAASAMLLQQAWLAGGAT
jgi:asparagine synthase (glutamine-hydrolysing)